MSYLTNHWSFDPFLILAIVVAVWYEIGLWRLSRRSRPERTRERRLRSLWFYGGLAVLLIAVESPIDYWADEYFLVHMIQHLLLMFAAPTLVVAGAPWQPLLDALPGRPGRGRIRSALTGAWSRPLRALGSFLARPWVSVALFNLVMIVWHLPGPLDLAVRNQAVRVWLLHGSYFAAGVLFWLQYIPSPPFRRKMPLVSQAGALLVTNVIMIGIAMTLSIFVSGSVYSVYDHVPGVKLAAVRGPADRRGHLVGMRGLLGPAHDDRDRQAADVDRGKRERGARGDPEPRLAAGLPGRPGDDRARASWTACGLSRPRRRTRVPEPAARGRRGGLSRRETDVRPGRRGPGWI